MSTAICSQCGFVSRLSDERCANCGAELTQAPNTSEHHRAAFDHGPGTASEFGPSPRIRQFDGVGAVLGPTLSIFTKNFWLITKLVLALFAPFEILKALSFGPNQQSWQWVVGLALLGLLCQALIAPSVIYALVTLRRTGVAPGLNESYRWGLSRLGKLCICAVMTYVLTALGLVLLIIPGIIVSVGLILVYPIVTLENLGPVDTLKRSWNLTKGHRWNIFAASLVMGLLCWAVSIPLAGLTGMFVASGFTLWPLPAAVALVTDIINESMTVLSLVIYLSIVPFAEPQETGSPGRES
jgi:uncharacterized membrane protein